MPGSSKRSQPAPPSDVTPRLGDARRWSAVALSIFLSGLAVSLAGTLLWHSSLRAHERQSFKATASDVSTTVATLLRRDADFVGTLRAVSTIQPNLTQTAFTQWYSALEGRRRQTGSLGTTIVRSMSAAALPKFLAQRNADPTFRALVGDRIIPVAISGRARYCLTSTNESVLRRLYAPAAEALQADWCSPRSIVGHTQEPLQKAATDSGQILLFPVTAQGVHTTFFEAAFYHRGASVASAAQRRAALVGWVVSSFDIATVIKTALGEHTGLAVTLYHSNPGMPTELVAMTGRARSSGLLTFNSSFAIDGQWTVKVKGAPPTGGLAVEAQTALLLLGGTIFSVLLSSFVLVLGRSRQRALAMVHEKTTELRHQALHDPLTDLPNRVLAMDRTEQMLARARRQALPIAALFIDLDGFKHINDTFGHAAGDELLRCVADRLRDVVRRGDTAARLSGDEFLVLVEGATLDAGPEIVAERLLTILRRPYRLGSNVERELTLSASIGVACGVRDSAEELVRDADLAMYEAKAAGRNRHVLFESSMQTMAQDRLTMTMDLAEALQHDELLLEYQPIVDLRSEAMIGAEALIRWEHPSRGRLSPGSFIPLAEENGLIGPIGRWVLLEACRQAGSWQTHGHELEIAVNVSGRQLDSDELINDVRDALRTSRLDARLLTLEVTETVLMRDVEASVERLRALKRLGVRISIDDFGTGYSSLAHLCQFPADTLKIDRSFICDITTSEQSRALMRTLVQLGTTLGVKTLAEGIEECAQLETLQSEHCEQGQGFLFSRPLDPEAMEAFIHAAGARTSLAVSS
ncbi:MAG TPA: EAL domain-containing protein [Solirubrobacteraceae bacterium]|jgi:diguanylate cyclase (GGDEF)-like protein|nr:EAL domain-containing protein [Solirubrobacteraceae bacterium]